MLFDIIPENFFNPLAAPGKVVYWECLCRLFAVTNRQLSFGVERDVLVDELQFILIPPWQLIYLRRSWRAAGA